MIRYGLIVMALLPLLALPMCASITKQPKTRPWEELALSKKTYAVYDARFIEHFPWDISRKYGLKEKR